MFRLDDLNKDCAKSFTELLTTRWDKLHDNTDIFRYKIIKLEEKIVDGKYLFQLNPDRCAKRRIPEDINNICQPFDKEKFNFTKVSPQEILFAIEGNDTDYHIVLINVSPISKYHSLLCPSVSKCLPQVVTHKSLELAVQILLLTQDRDVRLGFNSMCGFASVNHLHYHIFIEKTTLFVEKVKWQHINSDIYRLDKTYPGPAFCVEINKNTLNSMLDKIMKIFELFLKKSIAHNILLTKRGIQDGDFVNVFIWPRKRTMGAKQLVAFNVAVLELSGWFPIYDASEFNSLQADALEKELFKWNLDDFDELCEEIKHLF